MSITDPLLFTYRTGYDVYNSVIRWHPASIEDLAYTRDPASIGDPASIRTTDLDPRLVLETRLLFETWLLLEVLRCLQTSKTFLGFF